MSVLAKRKGGRPARSTHCRVRILMCSAHCELCNGAHRYTEPLDATRLDSSHVQITQPDPVWQGAIVSASDYVWAGVKV